MMTTHMSGGPGELSGPGGSTGPGGVTASGASKGRAPAARQATATQPAASPYPADKARIAVLVSGGGTNLQALIDAQDRGEIPHGRIELVISNRPDAVALQRAQFHGIPTRTFASRGRAGFLAQEEEIIVALELAGIDLIVLAGFLRILSRRFTDRFAGRIINVHPSLIPSFCGEGMYGLRVHEAALECGVKVTGATVHFVNEIPDGGEIIAQKAVEILPGDTPPTLQRRVMEQAEWVILPRSVEQVCAEILRSETPRP